MKLQECFRSFNLENVKVGPSWLQVDISFEDVDKDAAWELYIEMLTRIVTQPLEDGDEKTALDSVYSLFPTTREILRSKGRSTRWFPLIAIPVLNQVVRPFTAKWHRESLAGAFNNEFHCAKFREELRELQTRLRGYNRLLAHLAEVEDLTGLEEA